MEEQTNNIVEKKTNGFAIAGFILSFIFTILGLIFSIIGLCFVKKYQSGKGLSIAGIIISCVKLILFIVFIFIAPFILIGWMIDTFGLEFEEQFTKSYCETMSTQKEACTLKKDGTYDCIVVTCDFDNVKESKEDKEEHKENKIDKKTVEEKTKDKNENIESKETKPEITKFDETKISKEDQLEILMNFASYIGDNVKITDITNDEKLLVILRMYDFNKMSGTDVAKAVKTHFNTDIILKDGINPWSKDLILEYDKANDMYTYNNADAYGFGTTGRIENEISRKEENGILTIETYGVTTVLGLIGPIQRLFYDHEMKHEIKIDSKYLEYLEEVSDSPYFPDGESFDRFMEENKDSLPHYTYKFAINGDKVTFIEATYTLKK